MSLDSFLREELKVIDQAVLAGKTQFSFKDFALNEMLLFSASENVFFYESKDHNFSYLGLGISRDFSPKEALDYIKSHDHTLVYQGTFEAETPPMCYLPEWCFIKKDNIITLQLFKSQEFNSLSPSNLLFNPHVWESFVGQWVSYEEKPESDEWELMIKEAHRLFNKKELEKIVLSRKKIFTYDEKIELPVMFNSLYHANKKSSHFSVYHQFNDHSAFISLTPERLFTLLKGKELETISLAGSAPRGETPNEEQDFEETLISNERLALEHNLVTQDIKEKLQGITSSLEISPLVTMKLPYIMHRQAVIKGQIKDDITPFDLITTLHPTAAVGGIPSFNAKNRIKEIEKDNRGYYAAPVGVISKDFSEIVVGIRSGFIDDQTLSVFGGAGIVPGSTADEEWKETGIKMQPFVKVINQGVL